MKADPDQVEARVSWGNGTIASRLVALLWLVMAVTAANTSGASPRDVVGLALLGLAWGLAMWRLDLWWAQRPAVRLVDSQRVFTEVLRYAPTIALDFAAALLVFELSTNSGWVVFFLTAFAVQQALVSPTWYRRRAARRTLKMLAIEAGE